jgi:hypothetical protein
LYALLVREIEIIVTWDSLLLHFVIISFMHKFEKILTINKL